MRDLTDLRLAPSQTLFVDRIEEGVATLLLDDEGIEEANVPLRQLPEGVGEGDTLRVLADGSLAVDLEATEAARADVHSLMEELLAEEPEPPAPAPPTGSREPGAGSQ